MKSFSRKTKGYQTYPAYIAFKRFFDSYLQERDYEKVLSFLADDFYSLGTGGDEVAIDKEQFSRLLRAELDVITTPIEYSIKTVRGKEISEDIWIIMAGIEVLLPGDENNKIVYNTRFTGCFRLFEKDFTVISTHLSEPSQITEEQEFLPLKYVAKNNSIDQAKTDRIVLDIMSKSMPGGIISGYAEEGFPLYFVNDRFLEMLGYSSYEEYYEAAEGLGLTHIHPDDREMVNSETMHSYSTDTQYGIEYRIRHKDGHYIHVYDIGKKMNTPDGKEVIVCVLYDMTEDAKLKEVLIHESSYDFLTGLYNRGGGLRAMEHAFSYTTFYAFAFFDIDNLKQINDRYSHSAGDRALQYFAQLLKESFDERTILTRIGGDEFIGFYRDKSSVAWVDESFSILEQKYCDFIAENYPDSHSSVSIGCVLCAKRRTFDELYQITDKLMYEIKKTGKKGHKIVELD